MTQIETERIFDCKKKRLEIRYKKGGRSIFKGKLSSLMMQKFIRDYDKIKTQKKQHLKPIKTKFIMTKNPIDMSSKELEVLLKKKQEQEKKENEKNKKNYEKYRDDFVSSVVGDAIKLQKELIAKKTKTITAILDFKERAEKYSDVSSKSKGGFGLRSADGTKKIVYNRNVKSEYDERAKQAEELIKEFLIDKVKKKDKATFELIVSLMQKNKKGEYSTSLVSKLLKHENGYNDDRWSKAMTLFKESYNEVEISYSISFYTKDEQGKDQHINLNYSSL